MGHFDLACEAVAGGSDPGYGELSHMCTINVLHCEMSHMCTINVLHHKQEIKVSVD